MEIFNIDLVAVLVFIMPGYYFIAFSGLEFKTGFSLAVNSLFFGIVLAFVMNYFYPVEKYAQLLSNPLAGAVVLSLWGIVLGFATRLFLIDWIKRIFK
jgi:multisubunit Na+/H+ antiporter MnhC subunit